MDRNFTLKTFNSCLKYARTAGDFELRGDGDVFNFTHMRLVSACCCLQIKSVSNVKLYHLFFSSYWRGYIRLLSSCPSADRRHLATVVMQLDDVTLLSNQWGGSRAYYFVHKYRVYVQVLQL